MNINYKDDLSPPEDDERRLWDTDFIEYDPEIDLEVYLTREDI